MLADIASILRFHIVLIAVVAALAFGWVLTGSYPVAIALLGGVDWLLINLLNRITDLKEDEANGIRGTDVVARHAHTFRVVWCAVFVGSFALGWLLYPALLPYRLLVQLIGVGYSVPIVPTPSGLRRFKDLYLLKNLMSGVLFLLTVFLYPLVGAGWAVVMPAGAWAVVGLMVFFLAFELSYEVLYDLRDLEGDRLAGVPTFPVAHGPRVARRIVDGLLLAASIALAVAVAASWVGAREALMLVAPIAQWFFYRPRLARGLTSADCVWLTHLGSAQLVLFLVGTQVWLHLGLPANVYLESSP